jgi:hypothetical protein
MNDRASIFEERRGGRFLLCGGNKRRAEKHQTAVARELLDSIYDELRCTEEISMPSRQFRGVLWAGGGCVILEAADRGASSLTSANVPPTSAIDIAPHDRVRQESCSCFSG